MYFFKRSFKVMYLVLMVSLLWGCTAPVRISSEADLRERYRRAVADARIAEPAEISRNLVAVVDYNRDLVWKEGPGQQWVRVVTWTSWQGYDDKVGQAMVTSREIWVTVVPELQRFCQQCGHSGGVLTLRLEQLLGLPPHNGKTRFVEIWVSPEDLFRPSPDPEISDHEAGLNFPVSRKFVTIADDYVRWFDDLKNDSYGEDGYPWTRLGYTYDWGNPGSEIGLSEFVIPKGAAIEVHSVAATGDYCTGTSRGRAKPAFSPK